MLFRLSLLILILSTIACSHNSSAQPVSTPVTNPKPMSSSRSIPSGTPMITQVTLQAREQQNPPVGIRPSNDRDIGFADVFVTLENPTMTDTRITIQRIEIQDSHNHQVYLAMPTPKDIHLRPAEVSINDLHLTNKTGYPGQHPVKAVVTYQVQGSDRVIESAPAQIDRY